MRYLLSVLLLLVPSSAFAQLKIDVQVRSVLSISGLANPRLATNAVLADQEGSTPVIGSAAEIAFKTDSTDVLVIAFRSVTEPPEVLVINETTGFYALTGNGSYGVWVIGSNPKGFGFAKVTLGPPKPPEPPPIPIPPPSPIPPDAFGNIGQRVAAWSAGLPKRPELAGVYRKHSKRLKDDPNAGTINTVSAALMRDITTLLGTDNLLYKSMMVQIDTELQSKWPMSRGTFADFLECIAKGLSA